MQPNQNEQRRSQQQQEAQEYDSFLYKFQQQIIDAWKPVPHTSSNVFLYIILSTICIGLGLGLILSAPNTQQIYIRYDNICDIDNTLASTYNSSCTFNFTLTSTLSAPIYMYYGFQGFYQNHRRYLKYYSSDQLSTGNVYSSTAKTDCGDYYTNEQTFAISTLTNATAVDGTPLVGSDPAFPCGTIARIFYKLKKQIKSFKITDNSNSSISVSQTGIAWPSDIGRHVAASTKLAAIDVTDETWLVWFRPAARNSFYKLNGIINQDMPAGTYSVKFYNHLNASFGQKLFSLSKSNFVGNRDLFLGIAFLALGGGCFVLLIVFLAKWISQKRDRQKFQ